MRRALVLLLPLAAALALAGCGSRYRLPTQAIKPEIPSDKSYQNLATWYGMDGVRDILLTQGPGSQLFVLFQDATPPADPRAARGKVLEYPMTGGLHGDPPIPTPLAGVAFNTVFNPVALCNGNGPSRIFVLDQGDTCLARTPFGGGSCDGGQVVDFSLNWRVREYGLLGGDTLSTFTDTTMAYVNGIAADASGNVYVAGFAIVNVVANPLDPRVYTRSFLPRVWKYARGPRYPGVTPFDNNMPGCAWHRDTTFAIVDGEGRPQVVDPRGMQWLDVGGAAFYIADMAKNAMKKITPDGNDAYFAITDDTPASPSLSLYQPQDVAVDLQGFIYVADTGNQRVLRYDPSGAYVQKVNIEPGQLKQPLQAPVAVAADDSLVYVGDRTFGVVVRYQRRK